MRSAGPGSIGTMRGAVSAAPPALGSLRRPSASRRLDDCFRRRLDETMLHLGHLALHQLLDGPKIWPLALIAECERSAPGAGARRAPDAVHVALRLVRQLVVDDVRDAVERRCRARRCRWRPGRALCPCGSRRARARARSATCCRGSRRPAMPACFSCLPTRSAPRLVRVKTSTRSNAASREQLVEQRPLVLGADEVHELLDRSDGDASCGDTSIRTGRRECRRRAWRCPAAWSPRTTASGACSGSAATIFRTSRMKPMSSMRSASSSTRIETWSSLIWRWVQRSSRRPGVATRISMPALSAFTWWCWLTPPKITVDFSGSLRPYAVKRSPIWRASSRVGARMSARGDPGTRWAG